jgi:putative phosphoesterase
MEIYKTLDDIDLIVHLGDHWNDAKRMKEQLNVPLIGVKGNMDGSFARDGYHILETDFGKIFIAHGHMESVKQSYENIMYKAESLQCRAAFFGHTHIPLFAEVEGLYLLNPGSLSLPVGGRKGSYAVALLPSTLTVVMRYPLFTDRFQEPCSAMKMRCRYGSGAEIKALKAKVRRLEEDNAILKAATTFFVGELDSRTR